jgi:hypothetical protein
MDDIDASLIIGLIIEVSVCGDCIARKAGIPRGQVDDTLKRLTHTVKLTSTVARCDSCLKTSVVHRLG